MDHLDLPPNPIHPQLGIPFLARESYTGEDFGSYPRQQGWTDADLVGSDGCSKSQEERASFLQTWLFFGLLSTILQHYYTQDDWITSKDLGRQEVTISKLQARLEQLKADIDDTSDAVEYDSRASIERLLHSRLDSPLRPYQCANYCTKEIERVLDLAHHWNLRVLRLGPRNHLVDLVCLSVAALGETLSIHFGILTDARWLNGSDNNVLFQQMLDDGWCPLEILRLRESGASISDFYYISNMDRPGPTRCHQECRERIPLERIDDTSLFPKDSLPSMKCTAYQMDWETYRTKHVEGCSGCDDLVADSSLLADIIRSGLVPLLLPAAAHVDCRALSTGLSTETVGPTVPIGRLQIISSENNPRYTCISHVWSDGLGNPHANALPQCQYDRLSGIVRKRYPDEDVPFWIDTICIPREPKTLRRQAIMLMRKTYWDAESVLVLDSYLTDVVLRTAPKREAWLRVFNCGWNRRLWTLQESAVAKSVYFAFSDGFLDLDECVKFTLMSQVLQDTAYDLVVHLWGTLRATWRRWSEGVRGREEPSLGDLYDAVSWRATSILADEAICLSNIADVEDSAMEEIVLLESHEDRMAKFWVAYKALTTNILFWAGPKLSQYPLRWAPLSLLGGGPTLCLGHSQTGMSAEASFCDQGLKFKLPGMILGFWRKTVSQLSFLRTRKGAWYCMRTAYSEISKTGETDVFLAVVLQEPDPLYLETHPPTAAMGGLLVSFPVTEEGQNQSAIQVEHLSLVTLSKADKYEGWTTPLLKMISRFDNRYRDELSDLDGEFDGTKLGHFNDDSETKSDINVHWRGNRLSFDLCEEHLMFEVSEVFSEQEWCLG